MKVYWTADTHVFHANILRYTDRPQLKPGDLKSDGTWVSNEIAIQRAREMTDSLVHNINGRVKPEDMLIIVGDVVCKGKERGVSGCGSRYNDFVNALNCKNLVVVKGNHDDNNGAHTHITQLHYEAGGLTWLVVHNPAHADDAPESIDAVICGHVHKAWSERYIRTRKGRIIPAINVGVDVRRYMPIDTGEIVPIVDKMRKRLDRLEYNDNEINSYNNL